MSGRWPVSALVLAGCMALAGPVLADPFKAALAEAAAGRHGAAAALFRELAAKGDPEAAHNLAVLFHTGRGVPQNHPEAAFWAWQARLSGVAAAQALIDRLMPLLPDDRRSALATRLEAAWQPLAEQGDGAAMLALATILVVVRPEPDATGAHAWRSVAAALDVPGAVAARDASLSAMDDAARLTAQDVALERFLDWCARQADAAPPACAAVNG